MTGEDLAWYSFLRRRNRWQRSPPMVRSFSVQMYTKASDGHLYFVLYRYCSCRSDKVLISPTLTPSTYDVQIKADGAKCKQRSYVQVSRNSTDNYPYPCCRNVGRSASEKQQSNAACARGQQTKDFINALISLPVRCLLLLPHLD
jgi:hypothetical protein